MKKKTPARQERILENLRAGLTKEVSATQAGISPRSFYYWVEHDEQFAEEVQAAIDFSEAVLLAELKAQGQARQDWRASAWLLERRFPERWGAKRELEVNMKNDSNGIAEVMAMIEQTNHLAQSATDGDTRDELSQEENNDEET